MGNYQSIARPTSKSLMGGSKQKIFLAPLSALTTLQKPDPEATNVADRYLIKTAHVAATGQGFIELYVTPDTAEAMYETIGGRDRRSFLAKGEFYHPGESNEIIAFQNQAVNENWIILFPLPGTSECIQIGSDEFQAEIKPVYSTTKNAGDGRGTLFSFECFMPYLLKYTASTIPMKPAA